MRHSPLLAALLALANPAGVRAAECREAPAPAHTVPPAVHPTDFAPDTFAELLVETNAYGFVTRAEVKATSQPAFARACVDAVRRWRYAPAREFGQPAPARFIQPIRIVAGQVRIDARSYFPPATPRDR